MPIEFTYQKLSLVALTCRWYLGDSFLTLKSIAAYR